MNKLCLTGLLAVLASHSALAATPAGAAQQTPLQAKNAFIANLMKQMTLDEKIGQLRLISISSEVPQPMILEEIAAGRIGSTFNSITRAENRPLQEAAVARSRLKIPMFFAYDVVHGPARFFRSAWAWRPAGTSRPSP